MRFCVCVCVHIYIHTYIHTFHTLSLSHTHAHYTHCRSLSHTHTSARTHTHTLTHSLAHTRTHTHTLTHTHTHTHTQTQTHVLAHAQTTWLVYTRTVTYERVCRDSNDLWLRVLLLTWLSSRETPPPRGFLFEVVSKPITWRKRSPPEEKLPKLINFGVCSWGGGLFLWVLGFVTTSERRGGVLFQSTYECACRETNDIWMRLFILKCTVCVWLVNAHVIPEMVHTSEWWCATWLVHIRDMMHPYVCAALFY